ncbi:NnrS family protein [Lutibaculum baratangense]|nr:NnrS family protein [Lutibaculum baratangense]
MSPALAASRSRREAGWLFAAPFRPFFLFASLHAAASVPVWVWIYVSGANEVAHMPPLVWHAHEMVFGYLPAVMAGYLLSSTPNWTGRLPASGWPLAGLVSIWLAGRTVPLVAPAAVGLLVDAAFPLAVAFVLMREARAGRAAQSRHGLMLFPLLAAGSIAHRLFAGDHDVASLLARLGIAVGILLIAAVGGRLVPSLTRNALAAGGAERVPEPYGRFDVVVLLIGSAALAGWVAAPASVISGALLAAATLLHLVRLARWRGWLLRAADVLALHLGCLWLVVGTGLAALAADPPGAVPPDAALHAFSAGAIGVMTMAVMARLAATRGVTGHARADLALWALGLVNAGAVLRVAAPMAGVDHLPLLVAGAALWSGGFALFALAMIFGRKHRPAR